MTKNARIWTITLILIFNVALISSEIYHGVNFSIVYSPNLKSSQSSIFNFNQTNAFNHIKSQIDLGNRVPGTPAHVECADWIRSQMVPFSDEIILHNFTVNEIECKNILAKLNTEHESILIFGAHWDSRAIAEKDPVFENTTLPIPGANDGGSGVGVLIELGRVLFEIKETIDSQIWFLFIDAEDQGSGGIPGWNWCEGSSEFAQNINSFYDEADENISGFILLDMVGGHGLTFVEEAKSSINLQNAIFNQGRSLGYNDTFPENPKKMNIFDDHWNFIDIGIPSVDLIIDFVSGPWTHHHKHSDNLTNIDPNSLHVIGTTLESFIIEYYVQNNPIPWDIGPNSRDIELFAYSLLIIVIGGLVFYLAIKNKNKIKMKI